MTRDLLTKAAVALGAVVVGLVVLPVVEEIAVAAVLLLVVGACLALVTFAALWHVARRHPLADLLLGAWLVHRLERRMRRAVDARSWPTQRSLPWPPPDPRTRSPS